eukprot:Skav234028  [mRNA]  locus=scaffold1723:71150:89114:+ [translate_table: standard]
MCFPNRKTPIGTAIDLYLRRQLELPDDAVHQLFSANRWEMAQSIVEDGWCPDRGLPCPDGIFFLHIDEKVGAARSNFGDERYENSDMQAAVENRERPIRRLWATLPKFSAGVAGDAMTPPAPRDSPYTAAVAVIAKFGQQAASAAIGPRFRSCLAVVPQDAMLAALLLSALLGVEGTAQGALKLDNYTFAKVIALPGWSFLVKFDQSYAYGEKEDEFKLLCKHAHPVPHFMMAEVPVQEYGDKENDDLRDQFKLTKEDFPAYFLINEAFPVPGQRYTGDVKAEPWRDLLVTWLRRQKIPIPSLGTIDELDQLAEKFIREQLPGAASGCQT